jgi:FHS family glucose/mannose:H+ symporter-like MFS transporter
MDVIINAVVLAYVSLFAFGLGDNIRGPLFSEILSEFGLSDTVGSWIFALSSLFGFSSSFLSARLGRKLGHKLLLQISLGILGLALGVFSSAQSLFQMLVAAALFGMSLGSLGYCQNALVVLGTSPIRRQQWLSGLHAMYALSSLLAPSLVAILASYGMNWRVSFLAAGSFPLLALGVSFFLPLGRLHGFPHTQGPHRPRRRLLQVMGGACFAFYVVAEIMVSSRLGLFFRREMGESLEQASLKVVVFFILMFVGRGLFTVIRPPVSLVISLGISLFLSCCFLIAGLSGWPWFLVATGLTMAPFYGLAMAYLSEIFQEDSSQAISTAMAMQSILVVVMHLGVGCLSDYFSLRRALWVGPISLLLGLIFLWRTHESQKV